MMMRKESVAKETLHLGLGGVQPCDLGDLFLTVLHLLAVERSSFQGSQKFMHRLPAHYGGGGYRSMKIGKAEAGL